jgi:hypothetical protein
LCFEENLKPQTLTNVIGNKMKYYRLIDNLHEPDDRWFLKSLNVVDENKISVWKFLSPAKLNFLHAEALKITVREKGKAIDFTFADFEVLIVNEEVAFFLNDDECQLLPVEVEGVKNGHLYFVAVLLNSVDCLDEARSLFQKWQSDDAIRPDLAGDYKSISKLVVDPANIDPDNNTIFRLKKSDNIIIVNEMLKKQLEENYISGIRFLDVT